MKKNKWQDHYTRQAKQEGWLARSVFKLQEIDAKYHILRPGDRVLDLGCYPGSWSQYALGKVGHRGEVVGIDINRPASLKRSNFRFLEADILALDLNELRARVGMVDTVLSDLAPRTTGIRSTDTARSMQLALRALEIARFLLKTNGTFLCKIFEGEELKTYKSKLSEHFLRVKAFRPKAVRKGSREIYIMGIKRITS